MYCSWSTSSLYENEVIKKAAAVGVPCDVIKMQDYGMMNGKNVVAAADTLMKV